jgi:DNA repair protein RecO
MGDKKTLAILLRKTLLANDDALLEFLTSKWGRVTVFAKKFARSKKRAEIDFFRLLEIQIFQGRSSKSLKTAETTTLFSGFESSLEANQIGWRWISQLLKTLPEERPDDMFFTEVISWFAGISSENSHWSDAAFRMRLLQNAGDCPRFDSVRQDCFFNPLSKVFSTDSTVDNNTIYLSNEARQVCEFLRRSDSVTFYEKQEKLPIDALPTVQKVISKLEDHLF